MIRSRYRRAVLPGNMPILWSSKLTGVSNRPQRDLGMATFPNVGVDLDFKVDNRAEVVVRASRTPQFLHAVGSGFPGNDVRDQFQVILERTFHATTHLAPKPQASEGSFFPPPAPDFGPWPCCTLIHDATA